MKKYLDIEVHVEPDYVYLSTHDWQRIVKVLSSISNNPLVIKKKDQEITYRRPKILQ